MLSRLIRMLLVVVMFVISCYGHACAVTTGTTDGTYDFGNLGADDSMGAGSGYASLGDKFRVANGIFIQYKSYNSGPMTAIYPNSTATGSYTAVIKTEGGSTCKTFTFKDLGISAYSDSGKPVTFNSFDIVFKNIAGVQIGSTISLGGSPAVATDSITQLSELYAQPLWSVGGVATLEIRYTVSEGGVAAGAWDLNLENITIANVSAPVAAPAITGISIAAGPVAGATTVVISGTDFAGTTSVKFGASEAASFTLDSPTRITAVSPASEAGTVDITVTTPLGTSAVTTVDKFMFYPNQTIVTGILPSSGYTTGGTSVSIFGYNLTGATSVMFGSVAASSFFVNTENEIIAVSPINSIGMMDITVTTGLGTSATSTTDQFTYIYAFPVLGTADDTYSFGGLGADDSMGAGTGYASLGDKFKVGNALFREWNSFNIGQMTAIFLNSSVTTPQTAVLMAEGGLTCRTFTFKDLGISASSETGAVVTISSFDIALKDITGAQIGSTISLGSSGAVSTTSVTNISTLYGQGPWSVDGVATMEITYTVHEGGNAAAALNLNLENITIANVSAASLPTVNGISPSSGSSTGGTAVTITGADMLGASAVKFGSVSATGYTVDSATRITAVSPAGVAGMVADITVSTLVGTSVVSSADQFTFTQDQAKNITTGTSYASLATALLSASILLREEIHAYDSQIDGFFIMDRGITLSGGYDGTLLILGSNPTTLKGSLTVTNGASTAEAVRVKGELVVKGGSLRVKDVKVMP